MVTVNFLVCVIRIHFTENCDWELITIFGSAW